MSFPGIFKELMDDRDSQNYLFGNVNRRLLFSSQLSQGVESSQTVIPPNNENSIDKSLDVRMLSQLDFFTPAVYLSYTKSLYSIMKMFLLSYLIQQKILLKILEYLEKHLKNRQKPVLEVFSKGKQDLVLHILFSDI